MSLFADNAAPLGFPYWWEDRAPHLPSDDLPSSVDLLIVGAGYTGLSAAIAAHDAGAAVAILDAGRPGEGASTRNGGMFGAHPRLPFSDLVAKFGEAAAIGVTRDANAAFEFTRDLIAAEEIDCDLQFTGRLSLAWTRAHHDGQRRLAEDVASAGGGQMQIVPKAELHNEIQTDRYFGGALFPDHAALHPRKFHDGLMAAVKRRGIPVAHNVGAEGFQRSNRGFTVQTTSGVIRAQHLLAATNGYTGTAFPKLAARVFPLPSFLIATEPLSPNRNAELAPGRRMMVETRARHSYFRISPDGSRILFGGRAAMRPISLPKAARRLHATMCEIWPDLDDVKLSHVWTGNTGYSFTHTPHVGQIDGVHFAMGYSGSGVAMAPYLGMKAGLSAIGDRRGETAFSETHFAVKPFHFGRPWFLRPLDLWYRYAVDPSQNAAAARDRQRELS